MPVSENDFEPYLKKLGIRFNDPAFLKSALTHASVHHKINNERLEFLGDRVLGLAMSHMLYEMYPDESEGSLAKRFAGLVQGLTLAEIARETNLGDYIILSEQERTAGGTENNNILADTLEAFIGAYFLDSGYDNAAVLIKTLWGNRIKKEISPPVDPKTFVQEWAQARNLPLPVYQIVSKSGPDHEPEFEVSVSIKGFEPQKARGASRRHAEKMAAEKISHLLKQSDE